MAHLRYSLALVFLAASPWAYAQAPLAIEGPDSVPAYKQVRLALAGDFTDADWEAVGIVNGEFVEADGDELEQKGSRYLFTGPPGTYRVKVTALVDGRVSGRAKVVRIGEPGPVPPNPVPPGPTPPPPNPQPDPPSPVPPAPTPVPYAGKVWVIVVADAEDKATWDVVADRTMRQALGAASANLRAYKAAERDIQALGLDAAVRNAGGVPVALVLDETGLIRATIKPPTVGGIVAQVGQLRRSGR